MPTFRPVLTILLLAFSLNALGQDSTAGVKTYRKFSYGFRLAGNYSIPVPEKSNIDTISTPNYRGKFGLNVSVFSSWELHPNFHLSIEAGLAKTGIGYYSATRSFNPFRSSRLEWQLALYPSYVLQTGKRGRLMCSVGPSLHLMDVMYTTRIGQQWSAMGEVLYEVEFMAMQVGLFIRYSHDFTHPNKWYHYTESFNLPIHELRYGIRFRSPQKIPKQDEYVDEYTR